MAERPPARHSHRGSWEGGHRDDDYRGYRDDRYEDNRYEDDRYRGCRDDERGDYRHAAYQDAGYRDSGYRGANYQDTGYRNAGDRDAAYRDARYRDTAYQDARYRDAAYRDARCPDTSHQDARHRDADYRDADYEDADDRDAGYRSHRGWADESRAGWAGRDRRSWDNNAWDWEDEDPEESEYRGTGHRRDASGGAEGNERLTALTGSVLLVLFAIEGFTILSVHRLLTLHFFLGMLLIGPVALKACAVMYRFGRYYTGAAEYRRKGPPAPLLRVLGPLVLITSLAVLGTGVMLAIVGPSGMGTWLFLHRVSFILWFGVMTVHVLAYVWRLPRLVSGDLATRAGHRAHEVLAGRGARWLVLTASLLAGLLLAMLTVHRVDLWFGMGK
jgi:hypothetical protein